MLGLVALIILLAVYAIVITSLWRKAINKVDKPSDCDDSQQTSAGEARVYSDDEYKIKADEARQLTNTFQKFVPKQFVEHFSKHGTNEFALGTADEDNVAILFCDIRGFTGLSEKMKPQELMNFLNSYFLRMNAPIHTNHGFIDKFIGDAIMALFDRPDGSDSDKARDSISAALGLRKSLALYNEHRAKSGYEAIDIGIGIHFGPVILGTVGSDDRMDTTVIGDSVNIAQRLETLAPKYKVDIVVSRALIDTFLTDNTQTSNSTLRYRVIDWVRVKGRSEPIELIEVLSHLSEAEQAIKIENEAVILDVISARREHDFNRALALISSVQTKDHQHSVNDPIISHHQSTLMELIERPPAGIWDGALDT